MTTNIERAIEVIEGEHDPHFGPIDAPSLIYALNDADLLRPDLPTPRTVARYPGSACWEASIDPSVAARRHVWVRVDHMRRIKTNITGEVTPDEAREAAYALLAAADRAEQERNDG